MKRYANKHGASGVIAYESGVNFIRLLFKGSEQLFTYTFDSAGKQHIEKMKKLAVAGKGLSTYVSQNVHDKFEK